MEEVKSQELRAENLFYKHHRLQSRDVKAFPAADVLASHEARPESCRFLVRTSQVTS